MKTYPWEQILPNKLVQVILLKIKNTKTLLSTFLQLLQTVILSHLIILWPITTLRITVKITHSIPEVQILEIINWLNKMSRELIQDLRIRIQIQLFRTKERLIHTVLGNAQLVIIVSQRPETLKIELIDNNHNWIQRAKLLYHKENHLQIRLGRIIKIIKRKRHNKEREILQRLKVLVVQLRSKLFSNLLSTTFLKQKVPLVKHFLATTLAKTTNKYQHPPVKILLSLITSSS